jgi:hypothetical protein
MVPDPKFADAELAEAGDASAVQTALTLRALLAAKDLESFVFVAARRSQAGAEKEARPRRPSLRP